MEGSFITTEQLKNQGLSRRQIAQKLDSGELFRVRRGWYCTHQPTTFDQLLVLQKMHPEIVFTGKTALALHMHELPEGEIEALVPKSKRAPVIKGVKVTRSRCLRSENVFVFRCVSMIEAAATVPAEERPPQLTRLLNEHYAKKQGKAKWNKDVKHLRKRCMAPIIKKEFPLVVPGCYSQQELHVTQGLITRGYEVEMCHVVGGYMFDIWVKDTDVLAEVDSFAFHDGPSHHFEFRKDRWKQNAATMEGYRVLRFSTEDTFRYLPLVIEEIVRAVQFKSSTTPPLWTWSEGDAA